MLAMPKAWVEITSVYPARKEVQGRLRDGGKIMLSVYEFPASFRWPQEGEIWSIERDKLNQTVWNLCSRVQFHPEDFTLADLPAGALMLDSQNIVDENGQPVHRIYIQDEQPENAATPYFWLQTNPPGDDPWILWFDDGTES